MKTGIIGAGLAATLTLGFFAGRLSSDGDHGNDGESGSPAGNDGRGKTRVADRPANDRASTPGSRFRQEIHTQPSDRIPGLVFRALETGDPILRRQLMSELYNRMDASNYREMMAQILEISNATAREYPDEYNLMAMRAGQIAGQAVMDDWKEKGISTEAASKSMTGWAQIDPTAAKGWLDAQTGMDPKTRDKLLTTLIAGAMVYDPGKAAEMLSSMPEADRSLCLDTFTNNIVQTAGKDAGVKWLETIKGGDANYEKRATTSVFDRILWSGANRRNAASMVKDLEGLSSVVTIDENWISRSMGQIRDRKATGGIELLDEMSRSPILKDQPITQRLWNSSVDFALQRDRGAVDKWLADNPDSPIHAQVLEMVERKKAMQAAKDPIDAN